MATGSSALLGILACVVGLTAGDVACAAEVEARDHVLVVGRVSNNPKAEIPSLERFASYLAGHLTAFGISRAEARVAPDLATMAELLREGEVDLVSETPMAALHLEEVAGARLLLREWKEGVATYYPVFFGRRDAGIRTLADLVGRTIAFEDPGSTSAFLLPLAAMHQAGLQTTETREHDDPPGPGTVAYVFTGSEFDIALWVARGLADAGAFSNLDWQDGERNPAGLREQFTIFHRGEPILRSTILASGRMPEALRAAISDLLLSLGRDPEAKSVLEAYYRVSGYDRFEGGARRSLDEARSLYTRVRDRIR